MPLIYSGQEAPNYKRLAFFEKDVIEWKERCELHEFYKALLTLKKTNPALATDASLEIEFIDAGRKLLVFKRQKEGKEVVVGINFSGEETGYRLPNLEGTYRNLVSGELIAVSSNNDFKLPSWGFSIWIKQEA
jgi:glycosidase